MDSNNVKLSKLLFEYVDNIDEFIKKLNSFSNKNIEEDDEAYNLFMDYITSNCTYISSGVSRMVYAVNDDLVIKVSQDSLHGQNKNEIKLSKCTENENPVLSKIFAYDETSFRWIIAERALHTFESKEFQLKMLLGKLLDYENIITLSFDAIRKILYGLLGGNDNMTKPFSDEIEFILSNPNKTTWFEDFIGLKQHCQFKTNDLHAENFGLMQDGRLAIIDYGFVLF